MSLELPKVIHRRKRIGRGIAGRGAKSGRGQKGQRSRAGYSKKIGHEGGQTPLYMRLPKGRGTKQYPNSLVKKPATVSVESLVRFAQNGIVGLGSLRKAGVISRPSQKVKLVGTGKVSEKLTVRVHGASKQSILAVEKAGGKVELIK